MPVCRRRMHLGRMQREHRILHRHIGPRQRRAAGDIPAGGRILFYAPLGRRHGAPGRNAGACGEHIQPGAAARNEARRNNGGHKPRYLRGRLGAPALGHDAVPGQKSGRGYRGGFVHVSRLQVCGHPRRRGRPGEMLLRAEYVAQRIWLFRARAAI